MEGYRIDSPIVIYSWNSGDILDTAFFNSSIALDPSLLSGAMILNLCHLLNEWMNDYNDYLYFSMSLRRAIAIKSWDADNRTK